MSPSGPHSVNGVSALEGGEEGPQFLLPRAARVLGEGLSLSLDSKGPCPSKVSFSLPVILLPFPVIDGHLSQGEGPACLPKRPFSFGFMGAVLYPTPSLSHQDLFYNSIQTSQCPRPVGRFRTGLWGPRALALDDTHVGSL